jgi:hypothetical protein
MTGERFFFVSQLPDKLWGPVSLLHKGDRPLPLGVNGLWRETDHSPPSSAEENNDKGSGPNGSKNYPNLICP